MAELQPVVAFTLVRFPEHAEVKVLAHMALDRWPVSRAPGITFWRLFGVGRGRVFDPHPDWQRYALLTVWESSEALQQFEKSSPVMQRIQHQAQEVWTMHMRPVRWYGTWGGRDPFTGIEPAVPPEEGPWVILTRATIRPTKLRAFLNAVPAVAEQLLRQPALLDSVGVGEAPLLQQATLSLWRTLPAATTFAYGPSAHVDVVRRTHQECWYSEELFARLRLLAAYGTWNGRDPLRQL